VGPIAKRTNSSICAGKIVDLHVWEPVVAGGTGCENLSAGGNGYSVLEAKDGVEALESIARHNERFIWF
jgi:hypothetical protein